MLIRYSYIYIIASSLFPECDLPNQAYHQVCTYMSKIMGAMCEAGSADSSGAHEITRFCFGFVLLGHLFSVLCFVCCCFSLSFLPWGCQLIFALSSLNVPLVSFYDSNIKSVCILLSKSHVVLTQFGKNQIKYGNQNKH